MICKEREGLAGSYRGRAWQDTSVLG